MRGFNKGMIGKRVKFTSNRLHSKNPTCFPEVGTVGVLCDILNHSLNNCQVAIIQWPDGSTGGEDRWACDASSVILVK